MGRLIQASIKPTRWGAEAFTLVAHAKVLSGNKLEQLVVRLQRHSGRPKQECWRFVIQHGLKNGVDHRRWTEEEIEFVREELVKRPVEDIAKKLNRTPRAVRSMLVRNHLAIKEIRCDRFSVESLARALRVRADEIHYWIEQGWLQATISAEGRRCAYNITAEALALLYKNHLPKILARGGRNQALFEAYLQYCFSPKHTVGEQLLDVRRDKREREAYAVLNGGSQDNEEDDDDEDDEEYRFDLEADVGDGTDG
ncbi:MAG: hypothetical protein JWQ49_4472 [Edaphobacter sp.]|nr:hypothetical protein [Edaphobacter sp.]